jgi:hypothetical protein
MDKLPKAVPRPRTKTGGNRLLPERKMARAFDEILQEEI